MKCNHCKNPIKEKDLLCEWCGREITLYQSDDEKHPGKKLEEELKLIESNARKEFKDRLEIENSNRNSGLIGKVFGDFNREEWDEDYEEELNQYVYKMQATAVANFVLPTNPKLLEELLEIAENNYQLNKVSLWDDDNEDENKKLLAKAWKNLSKSVKNKLGLKPNTNRVDKAVNYLIENPTLKYALILLGIFIAIFLLGN